MTLSSTSHAELGNWRRPALWAGAVLLLTFGGFGGWAATAPLDSAVIMSGSIAIEGDRKVVQVMEGGKVSEILVVPDAYVHEGDVLFRFDLLEAEAGAGILRSQSNALQAEEARLVAEISHAAEVVFPDSVPADVRADQVAQFEEGRNARANDVSIFERQVEQLRTQMEGIDVQMVAMQSQIDSVQAEIDRVRPALEQGILPKNRGIELDRTLTDLVARRDGYASERSRIQNAVAEIEVKIDQVDQASIQQSSARLSVVRANLAELAERVSVAAAAVGRSEVRAPVSGKVVGLTVQTIGQIVAAGATLMEIVPDDGTLMVSARMSPLDVTHVHQGMDAEIRLPSFKRGETPITLGKITAVSADAMIDEVTRQSFYELKVSMGGEGFPDDVREQLVAGMPAEVIVSTGERTMLAYLVQPLTDAMRTGMREH